MTMPHMCKAIICWIVVVRFLFLVFGSAPCELLTL